MTEDKLIHRIRCGDMDGLEPLIELYYDDVYRFICFKTGNPEAAWDLTQETFLKVIRYFGSYAGRGRFKGYVFSIAVNVCHDFYRENWIDNQKQVYMDDEMMADLSGGLDETGDVDNHMAVAAMLKVLPDYQREPIIYRYILGYKIHEIAAITGEKIPTVKSRIRQGLKRLRKEAE